MGRKRCITAALVFCFLLFSLPSGADTLITPLRPPVTVVPKTIAPGEAPVRVVTPKPDLVITNCAVTPATLYQGMQQVGLSLTYKNVGNENAVIDNGTAEWNVVFSFNGVQGGIKPCPGAVGITLGSGGNNGSAAYNIPPGGERQGGVSISSFSACEPGVYTFTFKVDPDNRVSESNEGNNTAVSVPLTVVPSQADLVISSMVLNPSTPTMNSAFNLVVTIKNQGTTPAMFPKGSTVLDGAPYTSYAYEYGALTISPGGTKTYTLGVTSEGRKRGTSTWTVTLDPGGRVYETNKGNNQGTISVTVQ
jgi:hypothetical protein